MTARDAFCFLGSGADQSDLPMQVAEGIHRLKDHIGQGPAGWRLSEAVVTPA